MINSKQQTAIIIDTDIGDDADDVLAIALALKIESIDILGITTVFKNTFARAQIAKYFLKLTGNSHIPVHAGIGNPLVNNVQLDEIPCQFAKEYMTDEPDSVDALAFYESVLMKQKVNIVCIGPLTNIAKLINEKPHLLDNIDELIIMGGCFYRHANEWNIVCDPEAAKIVFDSGLNIKAVGLDVTTQCHLSVDYLDQIDISYQENKFLMEMCTQWFDKTGYRPILHDPLTIYALHPENELSFTDETVHIECSGEFTRGMTVCEEHGIWGRTAPKPNVKVASNINGKAFVDYYFNTVFIR